MKKRKKRKRQTIFQENHIDTALNMFYKLKKCIIYLFSCHSKIWITSL